MADETIADAYVSLITLREIRRYIVRSHAVMMAVFIGLVYGLVALSQSGMLVLAPLGGSYTVLAVTSPGTGPGYLILAPWGVLSLPLFGVSAMILVAIGVALGMTVGVLLAVAVVRRRAAAPGGAGTLGTVAGLTPAMVTLLAFGACCSTTAAATAGVGVVAQVSGSSTASLLANNWYLSIFQLGIVWIALVAQEALLRVYGGLFGVPGATAAGAPSAAPPKVDRRVVAGTLLRALLLIGGITWSLAMFADWATVNPATASAALWFDWIVVHQVLSAIALGVALFPSAAFGLFTGFPSRSFSRVVRGIALSAGALLAVGAPPPFAGWGIEGWGNELLAAAGAPTTWGAVPAIYPAGIALAFRWGVQYLLLGGVAIAIAAKPQSAFRPVLWSVGEETPSGDPRLPEPAAAATG